MIPDTLKPLAVPISSLQPYPKNPRNGDLEAIKESLRQNEQYRPIVVNERDNIILAGNHTYFAAMELEWNEIAATFVDVDPEQAARIVLVDNRTNDLAQNDDALIAEILQELPSVEGTGYTDEALEELLSTIEQREQEGLTDPDDVPEPPVEAVTKRGDIWLLGKHRVMCGDSTLLSDVDLLAGGVSVGGMWTDPPYGVNYVGKTSDALTIQNDGASDLPALLYAAFTCAASVLETGSPFYIAHPPGALSTQFLLAVDKVGWRIHQTLVWVKDSMVLGHSDYHYKHEPILYGYTPGPGRQGRGGEGWYGDNSQVSVFEIPRKKASREHPTGKPVGLIEIHLRNSSSTNGSIYDPFGGSGSTLIAAEKTNRQCYTMEISETYCDVIARRFQQYTGVLPILESTGEEHDFVSEAI